MDRLSSIISNFLIFIILIYQKYISIFIKPSCRFNPTCSKYAIHVIQNVGLIKGVFLIFKRILTCHPFDISYYKAILKNFKNKREFK